MHLEWSVFALADREAILDYICADSPRAAVSVDDQIEARVEGLARFPEMGRLGRIEGTRELVIAGTPYVAAYRIANDTVRILRVLHGAQEWPDEMPEEHPAQAHKKLASQEKQ
jgi:toxin ParE1/3/4